MAWSAFPDQVFFMLTRNHITHLRKLGDSQYRQETGLFIAEGHKIVQELLQCSIETIAVYCTQEQTDQRWLALFGDKVRTIREREMQQISQLRTPPGILAECRIPSLGNEKVKLEKGLSLVLDGIADPGNMGTIIRTAEWFGVRQLYCSADSADPWQPKVVQSAMGSLFRIRIIRTDIIKLIGLAKEMNFTVYGALMDGRSHYDIPLKADASMLVIGSESHGIREGLLPLIDVPVTIRRAAGSMTESLNAGIAAAILLSEFERCKQKSG